MMRGVDGGVEKGWRTQSLRVLSVIKGKLAL